MNETDASCDYPHVLSTVVATDVQSAFWQALAPDEKNRIMACSKIMRQLVYRLLRMGKLKVDQQLDLNSLLPFLKKLESLHRLELRIGHDATEVLLQLLSSPCVSQTLASLCLIHQPGSAAKPKLDRRVVNALVARTGIRELGMSLCEVPGECIRGLSQLHLLRGLTMVYVNIPDNNLSDLLSCQTQLTRLTLQALRTNGGVASLEGLKFTTGLLMLRMMDIYGLSGQQFNASLSRLTSLTHLELKNVEDWDEVDPDCSAFAHLTALQTVYLECEGRSWMDLAGIQALETLPQLTNLTLKNMAPADLPAPSAALTPRMTGLKTLVVDCSLALATYLLFHAPHLQTLELEVKMPAAGKPAELAAVTQQVAMLAQSLPACCQQLALNFDSQVYDGLERVVAALSGLRGSGLIKLKLAAVHCLDAAGVAALGVALPQLQELHLSYVTLKNAQSLQSLYRFPALRKLTLEWVDGDLSAGDLVAFMVKMPEVEVDMQNCEEWWNSEEEGQLVHMQLIPQLRSQLQVGK